MAEWKLNREEWQSSCGMRGEEWWWCLIGDIAGDGGIEDVVYGDKEHDSGGYIEHAGTAVRGRRPRMLRRATATATHEVALMAMAWRW
ncbi:hypothetical protein PIB30_054252 [Stylosanthes scabra]|uniref:Uncharacterized protein n=1 Tax=Stylosanthes scabra TaxID=79078 RepID=A0ABU6QIC7_9FABA|nr:hypothetical protein [Stylosanthes scabra]